MQGRDRQKKPKEMPKKKRKTAPNANTKHNAQK